MKKSKNFKKPNNRSDWRQAVKGDKRNLKAIVPKGKDNDIAWYNQNPLLMKLSGLVNFYKRAGRNVVSELNPNFSGTHTLMPSLPGIARISWIPTPGVAVDGNDAINVTLNKMYTDGRLKNINYSTYDPADVGFYLLACDSIFAFYAYMQLIYTHIKTWNFENQYYPQAIAAALNVDFNDIRDNLADFLFYINLKREEISKLKIPKNIPYIARHMHMSAQVYKDNENEKSQLYVLVPQYLYKYDATIPALIPVPIGASPTKLTLANIKTIFDDMLNKVLPDEDFMTIAADIVRYYESTTFWEVLPLDWNTINVPVYNKEMLWQIHNADFLAYTTVSNLNITQTIDANLNAIVVWNPTFTTSEGGINMKRLIDSNSPVPTAEEIVESTRLKFGVKNFTQTAPNTFTFNLDSCGSEIITNATVYYYDTSGVLTEKSFGQFVRISQTSALTPAIYFFVTNDELIMSLTNRVFEYAPIQFYILQNGANPALINIMGINAQLDNYAVLENQQLLELHTQCLFSMFNLGSAS